MPTSHLSDQSSNTPQQCGVHTPRRTLPKLRVFSASPLAGSCRTGNTQAVLQWCWNRLVRSWDTPNSCSNYYALQNHLQSGRHWCQSVSRTGCCERRRCYSLYNTLCKNHSIQVQFLSIGSQTEVQRSGCDDISSTQQPLFQSGNNPAELTVVLTSCFCHASQLHWRFYQRCTHTPHCILRCTRIPYNKGFCTCWKEEEEEGHRSRSRVRLMRSVPPWPRAVFLV